MKSRVLTSITLIGIIMAGVLAFSGCSKNNQVDTSKLEKSFEGSEANVKATVSTVVDSLKKQEYSTALGSLQKLASEAKITPEQQQAVKDVMVQVQNALKEMASKAADGANKALGDVQKSLPK